MKNKLIFSALLFVLLFVSCNSESGQNWFREAITATEPVEITDPNRDSIYFKTTSSPGTIRPLQKGVLPLNLLIPAVVDGVQVQKVTGCFSSPVRTLIVPSGVTVASGAFYNCSDLEKVVFLSGVVSVVDGAFVDCTALKRVEVYCSFTAISSAAFSADCTADFVYGGTTYEGFNDFLGL